MTKLSIIVPVYNVDNYIRPCFESIFKQGLDDNDYEIIIVNDGSTDKSMEMIEDIISQHNNITIINQENQGLSVARNNGICAAKGEYIFMPDPDDLLTDNSLEISFDIAIKTKADLVVADYVVMTDSEIAINTSIQQKPLEVKENTGTELFLNNHTPYHSYVWHTLFRRDFLLNNNISFYPGIRFQDVPFTYKCYLNAKKCIKINRTLNIYRIREGSATGSFSKQKAKEFTIAIRESWNLTKWEGHTSTTLKKLKNSIYKNLRFLISWSSYSLKISNDRKDIIDYIKKEIPDLKFSNGVCQVTTTLLMRHFPYFYINTHYYIRILINKLKKLLT